MTLSNWDLGGEPSAWAYLHAGELFPAVEILAAGPGAALEHAEAAEITQFEVQAGVSLDEYVARGPVSGIVVSGAAGSPSSATRECGPASGTC